jgi:site-specific DNA recombinase
MLLNERYVGHFVWNRRKFIRVPGQRHRRAVKRPRSEWRVQERPELAIISPSVWALVQRRIQRRAGRPPG